MRIRMNWPAGSVRIELEDGATARAVIAALPAEATAHRWGDEVYFRLPVDAALDADADDVVEPGTVCYWVEGGSVAIPFGPTPASVGDECRLVTRVNRIGRVLDDPAGLDAVGEGDVVVLEAEPS
ncbi:MAG: cyclophilin-like fold protein [Gammaproteobacteria bacterium]|nr:cyclophilin-like fold protein [Gammaproteobacteria bacterium]